LVGQTEARYAAVETFGLYNIGDATGKLPTTLAANGIYELQEIALKPVTCQLPQGKLLIEAFNYYAPEAKGMCGGVEDADLTLSLDGVRIAEALTIQ
jgi:hypothetical protein